MTIQGLDQNGGSNDYGKLMSCLAKGTQGLFGM